MENELPNIWWLLDPMFIKRFCEERQIEPEEDSHYRVMSDIRERLEKEGVLKSNRNGVTMSTQVMPMEDIVYYRRALLRMVALDKGYDHSELPVMNIILNIPTEQPPLIYMNEIVKITKGVRSFIKPIITFVNIEGHMVTIEI